MIIKTKNGRKCSYECVPSKYSACATLLKGVYSKFEEFAAKNKRLS